MGSQGAIIWGECWLDKASNSFTHCGLLLYVINNTVTLPAPAILARLGFKLFSWLTKDDLGLPGHRCMPFLQGNCSLSKMGTYSRPNNLIISPTYIPSPPWAQKKISPFSRGIGVSLKGPWTLIFLLFCTLCLCLLWRWNE